MHCVVAAAVCSHLFPFYSADIFLLAYSPLFNVKDGCCCFLTFVYVAYVVSVLAVARCTGEDAFVAMLTFLCAFSPPRVKECSFFVYSWPRPDMACFFLRHHINHGESIETFLFYVVKPAKANMSNGGPRSVTRACSHGCRCPRAELMGILLRPNIRMV